jgi:hypothetical protein
MALDVGASPTNPHAAAASCSCPNSKPNSRLQDYDHLLDYSFAYFTMDLLHYLA